MTPLYDVVGIGNALVDVVISIEEDFLSLYNLSKGGMGLINLQSSEALYTATLEYSENLKSKTSFHKNHTIHREAGGSAANTMVGISSLGGKSGYLGRVASDEWGSFFKDNLEKFGVKTSLIPRSGDHKTGRSHVFVTPDGERTMETYLGAASGFCAEDLSYDMISHAQILYLEGYLWDLSVAKESFKEASKISRSHGRKVAFSLSDIFCVERHRKEFQIFISNHVDILFGNEQEILSFVQEKNLIDALPKLRSLEILIVATRGAQGALILQGDKQLEIPAISTKILDTTGAGDIYASGFLYGLAREWTLEKCGHLGSLCSSHMICHFGARPKSSLENLLQDMF